jgi:hypothetical protein
MRYASPTTVLLVSLLSLALALPGTGCRGRVGQLLNNDPLAAQGFDEGPQITRTPGVDWTAYRSVFVQPVSMDADATQGRDVDDADVAALPGKFRDDLQKAFDGKFTRAQAPAAGAIVVDARIIRAVPNLPLRNIAPQSQVGRTGYGYAVAVITLRDGASGQVLASARESRATSRFGLEKMSEWGSVEKSFEEWAAGAVKLAE